MKPVREHDLYRGMTEEEFLKVCEKYEWMKQAIASGDIYKLVSYLTDIPEEDLNRLGGFETME